MRILFHYHIPVYKSIDGSLFTHSFLGVFLDHLAKETKCLTILTYKPLDIELEELNYKLDSKNIVIEELGYHSSVPKRIIKFIFQIPRVNRLIHNNDVFLLRAPTPLSLFTPILKCNKKLVFYLVGDYTQGLESLEFNFIKNTFIKILSYAVEFTQKHMIKKRFFLANSQKLIDSYKPYSTNGKLIRTTTLTSSDFFDKNIVLKNNIKILFTGRIAVEKGIFELLEACIELTKKKINIEFHMAGMIIKNKYGKSVLDELFKKAEGTAMENKIYYHGLKKVGNELNEIYRMCDLYVIPSQSDFEGFPRTIWEAMANGLPVIASDVGGIPYYLINGKSAILVKPKRVDMIVNAILELIKNPDLLIKIRHNAYDIAKKNTLEIQAKLLIDTLNLNIV